MQSGDTKGGIKLYSCLWTRPEAVDLIGPQGHEQTAGGKEGGAGKGARRRFLSREKPQEGKQCAYAQGCAEDTRTKGDGRKTILREKG